MIKMCTTKKWKIIKGRVVVLVFSFLIGNLCEAQLLVTGGVGSSSNDYKHSISKTIE